jgi:hypothetical protein
MGGFAMMETAAANTTDEEGELVTHDDLLDPLEQLSTSRDEVAELVKKANVEDGKSPVNYDIEQNIREIRAILKMNAEILDRCMKFRTSGWKNGKKWYTSFKRIVYKVVTTRAWNDGAQVITHPIHNKNEFDTTPLSELPKGIDDIFVSVNMIDKPYSSFIDFEAFFKKCLILHETVLEQFLPKLKEHLMSIQVCLGEIDAWVIQEPQKNITFLEETFEKKMEMPDENVTLGRHKCECETHDPNEICLSCGKKYCEHDVHNKIKMCPDPLRITFSRLFHCRYFQVLKQCKSKGKHETTFNLADEKERARLTKLLEFMEMY